MTGLVTQGIHRYVDEVQLNMKRRNAGIMQWEKRLTGEENVDWNQKLSGVDELDKNNYLTLPERPTFSNTLAQIHAQPSSNRKLSTQVEGETTKKIKKAEIQAPVQAVAKNKNEALTKAILSRNFISSNASESIASNSTMLDVLRLQNMMTGVNGAFSAFPAYPYTLNYDNSLFNHYLNGYSPFYTVAPSLDKLY
ncbi:hypothetical protein J2Z32_002562 [Paenibacillus turicensis]|uniref:Uncharacterized protein n=1 Tax=Paenibacillus turicensis TaxID=160487 RepID=A0ABS4FTK8_9BACL|nr:hypothetical protein [Paenibacillus turicensis]MBP1905914.1 hypothetical protein [Paenibacillus turicensis]